MTDQKGQILVVVFVALGVVLFTVLSVVAGAQIFFLNSTYSADSEKATALAEAGLDKAVASLNKIPATYNGEGLGTNGIALGDGEYSVKITSKDASTKIIESTGYIPSKDKPKAARTVKIEASKGVGVSFVYGVQVGDGGLEMRGQNNIYGSIYSNGNIVVSGPQNKITGDAWVAGGQQPVADQQTDCSGSNCQDFFFGKNTSGEKRLDIAQSFQPQTSAVLNKISLKVRKIGNPPDITVRILKDSCNCPTGTPDKNNVLATGTLYSALVTSSFPNPFIDVTFNTTPNLTADYYYWIMVDTSSDNTNYWSWQNDIAQSYNRGQPKWSEEWDDKNPLWNNLTGGGDLSFEIYMGGVATSLTSTGVLTVEGDAHANTISGVTINGKAYYQSISGSTVGGSSCPNPNCIISSDPPPKVFPISDANINAWIADATAANPNLGAPVCGTVGNPGTWGPGKYTGNIVIDNGCFLDITSPVYIEGNITLNNNNVFKLPPSYGSSSGLIVVSGQVVLDNNNHVEGSGTGSSILMVLSAYNSKVSGEKAIDIKNNGNTGVFYAHNGIIAPGLNNEFKELTAWKISLLQQSDITYQTGLSSTLFSSGPGGTFSLVKGTYQVK